MTVDIGYSEDKEINIKGWKTVPVIEEVACLMDVSRVLLASGSLSEICFTLTQEQIGYLDIFLNFIRSPDIEKCSIKIATSVWWCAAQCCDHVCRDPDYEEPLLTFRCLKERMLNETLSAIEFYQVPGHK